jgi:hypothetical protein
LAGGTHAGAAFGNDEGWGDFSSWANAYQQLGAVCALLQDTARSWHDAGYVNIRLCANYDGLPVYGPETHTAMEWFHTAAFLAPPAYSFG